LDNLIFLDKNVNTRGDFAKGMVSVIDSQSDLYFLNKEDYKLFNRDEISVPIIAHNVKQVCIESDYIAILN
jgi:hypothetical protein